MKLGFSKIPKWSQILCRSTLIKSRLTVRRYCVRRRWYLKRLNQVMAYAHNSLICSVLESKNSTNWHGGAGWHYTKKFGKIYSAYKLGYDSQNIHAEKIGAPLNSSDFSQNYYRWRPTVCMGHMDRYTKLSLKISDKSNWETKATSDYFTDKLLPLC